MIKLKNQKFKPTNKERNAQQTNVNNLLGHWIKMKIIYNILYMESDKNLQLVLPSKLHILVYDELNIRWDTRVGKGI